MARLIRRASALQAVTEALSPGQYTELLVGFPCGSGSSFSSGAEYRAAWWAHRAALMAEASEGHQQKFKRPDGFWSIECGLALLGIAEIDRWALVELGCELLPAERSDLTPEEKSRWERARRRAESGAMDDETRNRIQAHVHAMVADRGNGLHQHRGEDL